MTEEEEIGTYRATAGFIYNAFYKTLIKDRAGLQAAFGTWNTLSPAKKRGVMKTALDFLYLNIVAFVAGSFVGSKFALGLPENIIKKVFGAFLMLVSIKSLFFTK